MSFSQIRSMLHYKHVTDPMRGAAKAMRSNSNERISPREISYILCGMCGKIAERRCSACKVRYCNEKCQLEHWPKHKLRCNKK